MRSTRRSRRHAPHSPRCPRGHPAELQRKLGDRWEALLHAELTVYEIQLGEADGAGLKLGATLDQHINPVAPNSLKISPGGKRLAYVLQDRPAKAESENSDAQGTVADIGGSLYVRNVKADAKSRRVANLAAWGLAWQSDSWHLVYATTSTPPSSKDNLALGEIRRCQVVDPESELATPAFPDPESLVSIAYFPDIKIVCLQDGRILFNTIALRLPASTKDQPKQALLFSVEPEREIAVTRLTAESIRDGQLHDGFGHGLYEVRPGGTDVTVLNIESGTVGIYTFATGACDIILDSPADEKKALLEVPTWRTEDELSLVVPAGHAWGSEKRPELVLYSLRTHEARCISRSWPDDIMQEFMPEKPDSSQPAPNAQSE